MLCLPEALARLKCKQKRMLKGLKTKRDSNHARNGQQTYGDSDILW